MGTTLNIISVCFIIICITGAYGGENPRIVRLIAVGKVQQELLDELANSLEKNLGVVARVEPGIEVPAEAYNSRRNQYFSTEILRVLNEMKPNGKSYLLGITELDLYVPTLNYVFGEAMPLGNVAVISLHRLREEFYGRDADRSILTERMAKEAVHELGHVWGIRHCPDPSCVMFFSNSLEDTDRKSASFCDKCNVILERHKK